MTVLHWTEKVTHITVVQKLLELHFLLKVTRTGQDKIIIIIRGGHQDDIQKTCCKIRSVLDFPGGTVVKNPPANAGDMGSIPGLGRSHMPWSN